MSHFAFDLRDMLLFRHIDSDSRNPKENFGCEPWSDDNCSKLFDACNHFQILSLYLVLRLDAIIAVCRQHFSPFIICRFCRDFQLGILVPALPPQKDVWYRQTADW